MNGANVMSNTTTLKPELAEIVRKIKAYRTVNKMTGFVLSKTIGDLLRPLSPDDLMLIGEALGQLKESEVKHLSTPQIGVRRYDPQGK
jgi:hypothetical protein